MRVRLVLAGLFLALAAPIVHAQATNTGSVNKPPEVFLDNHRPLVKKKDKAPTSRNVAGKVVDTSGQPLEGAMVTLTNLKTKERTSFFTKSDGRYNFDELSLTSDYQLQARFKSFETELRKVSQYDPNVNTVRILEVDTSAADSANAKPEKKQP